MEDRQIIELYFARDEGAIAATEEKYGAYCACIAGNVLDSREDVEEVLSDTWLRAWNSIPPQKPENLKLYLARIARNLSFDRFRNQSREKRGGSQIVLALEELSHCIPTPTHPGMQMEEAELSAAVNAFLATLPKRDRVIFLRRYFYTQSFEQIASTMEISQGAVRTALSRTRKKLKHYLIKEGFDL